MQADNSAADTLAMIDQSRARLAAASDAPPLRHLVFAAMIGGLVAAPVLPVPLRFAALALLFATIALVMRWDRRRTGMFVNGYRTGRTLWVTLPMLAVILLLYGVSSWLAIDRHAVVVSLLLAAVSAAVAGGGSVLWCRVFRRELLGPPA